MHILLGTPFCVFHGSTQYAPSPFLDAQDVVTDSVLSCPSYCVLPVLPSMALHIRPKHAAAELPPALPSLGSLFSLLWVALSCLVYRVILGLLSASWALPLSSLDVFVVLYIFLSFALGCVNPLQTVRSSCLCFYSCSTTEWLNFWILYLLYLATSFLMLRGSSHYKDVTCDLEHCPALWALGETLAVCSGVVAFWVLVVSSHMQPVQYSPV